jgi:hypothetical protein
LLARRSMFGAMFFFPCKTKTGTSLSAGAPLSRKKGDPRRGSAGESVPVTLPTQGV